MCSLRDLDDIMFMSTPIISGHPSFKDLLSLRISTRQTMMSSLDLEFHLVVEFIFFFFLLQDDASRSHLLRLLPVTSPSRASPAGWALLSSRRDPPFPGWRRRCGGSSTVRWCWPPLWCGCWWMCSCCSTSASATNVTTGKTARCSRPCAVSKLFCFIENKWWGSESHLQHIHLSVTCKTELRPVPFESHWSNLYK